jgi:hypothetical protein
MSGRIPIAEVAKPMLKHHVRRGQRSCFMIESSAESLRQQWNTGWSPPLARGAEECPIAALEFLFLPSKFTRRAELQGEGIGFPKHQAESTVFS